ncbi:hypothetical protein [Treponema pedis]|uniref:Uncharacterized protein n=1 Tax=Treponema pedis TaxID=409322 RepID=A0A7S6WR75_9SPIR|nr:hypothetical protein [Treponema pedis]QOW61307.1 hypothetical protein IFE08_02625 [Treponema pedis]
MLSPDLIKWIKNVNNNWTHKAYFDVPDEFQLHFPNHHKQNVLTTPCGEIILLFQKVDSSTDIKFTHLVTPVNDILKDHYKPQYRYSRRVKVIAQRLEKPYISKTDTSFRNINLGGVSQGNVNQIGNMKHVQEKNLLSVIQKELYDLFLPYVKNNKIFTAG